ncbi:MAG: cob(I)yrinic acid a,c-diamide adenosyltransferase [bacterium]|nr:cob(I)yrinic acid a,c-diamide adenosyltransferase [bacterium]
MIIIFTGNGKGKTTAAIGQAVRAVGNGSCVLMVQLIKGPWKSGEDNSVKIFGSSFKIEKMGKGFVRPDSDGPSIALHAKAARKALDFSIGELEKGTWKILILDEVWVALSLRLLTEKEVKTFIEQAEKHCDHLIMTGRGCPQVFMDRADLVTEMKEVKHPFSKGVQAAKCVEY